MEPRAQATLDISESRGFNIRNQLINWLYPAIAVLIVMSCISFFLLESGSANSLPTYVLAIATCLLLVLRPGLLLLIDTRLLALLLAFLIYMAASIQWADTGESTFKHLGFALLVISFCLSTALCLQRYPAFLYWLPLFIVLAAVINSGYSIYLHYSLGEYDRAYESRLYALGRLSNPVVSALSYGVAAILCAHLAMIRQHLAARRRGRRGPR